LEQRQVFLLFLVNWCVQVRSLGFSAKAVQESIILPGLQIKSKCLYLQFLDDKLEDKFESVHFSPCLLDGFKHSSCSVHKPHYFLFGTP
jgi:hypothetical protein